MSGAPQGEGALEGHRWPLTPFPGGRRSVSVVLRASQQPLSGNLCAGPSLRTTAGDQGCGLAGRNQGVPEGRAPASTCLFDCFHRCVIVWTPSVLYLRLSEHPPLTFKRRVASAEYSGGVHRWTYL